MSTSPGVSHRGTPPPRSKGCASRLPPGAAKSGSAFGYTPSAATPRLACPHNSSKSATRAPGIDDVENLKCTNVRWISAPTTPDKIGRFLKVPRRVSLDRIMRCDFT